MEEFNWPQTSTVESCPSPYEVVYGRNPNSPMDLTTPFSTIQHSVEMQRHMQSTLRKCMNNLRSNNSVVFFMKTKDRQLTNNMRYNSIITFFLSSRFKIYNDLTVQPNWCSCKLEDYEPKFISRAISSCKILKSFYAYG